MFHNELNVITFQTYIATKENIQGPNALSLKLFYHDLSLGSESSTMEKKTLCVFNFITVTERIL